MVKAASGRLSTSVPLTVMMCAVKPVIAVAAVKLMLSWPTLVIGLDALALMGPAARAGAPVTSERRGD